MSRDTALADNAIQDLAELGILAYSRVVARAAPDALARTVVPFEALVPEQTVGGDLTSLGSNAALVLTHPELAILEAFGGGGGATRVLAFLPPVLGDDRVASLRANLPAGVDVTFLGSTDAPVGVSPADSAFLTVGFEAGGGYALVPWWTADVLHAWRHRWFGRSLLLDPLGEPVRSRPPGWTSIPMSDHFTAIIGRDRAAAGSHDAARIDRDRRRSA